MESQETRKDQLNQIVNFLHIAEGLKQELRHSWLSNGRQESVAEHSWRLALMIMVVAPCLEHPVDTEKCLRMALLHDLAEAEVSDIPAFECQQSDLQRAKYLNERQAMISITNKLGKAGQELHDLWEEYERRESYEAQLVRALDKIEVQLQHNEADTSTWLHVEKLMIFQSKWMKDYCEFDTGLTLLCDLIQGQSIEKLQIDNMPIHVLRAEALLKEE